MTTSTSEEFKPDADEQEGVTLLDLFNVLLKRKRFVFGFSGLAALVTVVICLMLNDVFTGASKILPPQQTQSTSAVLSQLGSLAGLTGSAGLKNPNDLYVGMLKSRTVADSLIQRFDLGKVYSEKLPTKIRKQLTKMTTVSAGRDGIITIEVDDEDPKRAADMANAYVDELFKLTKILAVTEASQRRLFFEQQAKQAKEKLLDAELAARQAMERGGLVGVESEGRALLETNARLQAQISAKEIQIGAMRVFAADGNPQLKSAQQELEMMKRELAKSEGSGRLPAQSRAGSAGVDNLSLLRNVKYYETMYELLARQLETARLDEAKDSAIIQVLDAAVVPDIKSKPARAVVVIVVSVIAFFLAIVWALLAEAVQRHLADPLQSRRVAEMRRYAGWR